MEMLGIHETAVASANVAYHEFLLRFKRGARVVYGLVEGREDPMFYRGLIEAQLPPDWALHLIPAGNKSAVLTAIDVFDWNRFSRQQVCFFVDRDLDDFMNWLPPLCDNLYVTECYSIENMICTFSTFRRVVEEVLNIANLTESEEAELRNRFERNLLLFQESLVVVMVQLLAWKRAGLRACADNFEPRRLFHFVDSELMLRSEYANERSRVSHIAGVLGLNESDSETLGRIESEFRALSGPERFIRGKYLLWFFVEFALELHRSVSSILVRFPRSPKLRIALGAGNAMVLIGPRSRCPESLRSFLKHTYGHFVNEPR